MIYVVALLLGFWGHLGAQNHQQVGQRAEGFVQVSASMEVVKLKQLLEAKSRVECKIPPGVDLYPLYPYKSSITSTLKTKFLGSPVSLNHSSKLSAVLNDDYSINQQELESINGKGNFWSEQLKKYNIDIAKFRGSSIRGGSKKNNNDEVDVYLQNLTKQKYGGSCFVCLVKNAYDELLASEVKNKAVKQKLHSLLSSLMAHLQSSAKSGGSSTKSGRCLEAGSNLFTTISLENHQDDLNNKLMGYLSFGSGAVKIFSEYEVLCKSYKRKLAEFNQENKAICAQITKVRKALESEEDFDAKDLAKKVASLLAKNDLAKKNSHESNLEQIEDRSNIEGVSKAKGIKKLLAQENAIKKSEIEAKKQQLKLQQQKLQTKIAELQKEIAESQSSKAVISAREAEIAKIVQKMNEQTSKHLQGQAKIPDQHWNNIALEKAGFVAKQKSKLGNKNNTTENQDSGREMKEEYSKRELFDFYIPSGKAGLYYKFLKNHYDVASKTWQSKSKFSNYTDGNNQNFIPGGDSIDIELDLPKGIKREMIYLVNRFGYEIDPNSFAVVASKDPSKKISGISMNLLRDNLGMYKLIVKGGRFKDLKIKYTLRKVADAEISTANIAEKKILEELPENIIKDLKDLDIKSKSPVEIAKLLEGYILSKGIYTKNNNAVNDYVNKKSKDGIVKTKKMLQILTQAEGLPEEIKGLGMDCDMYAGECFSSMARNYGVSTLLALGYQNYENPQALEKLEMHGWAIAGKNGNWQELNPTPGANNSPEKQKLAELKVAKFQLAKQEAKLARQKAELDKSQQEINQEQESLQSGVQQLVHKQMWKNFAKLEELEKIFAYLLGADSNTRAQVVESVLVKLETFAAQPLPNKAETEYAFSYLQQMNFNLGILELLAKFNNIDLLPPGGLRNEYFAKVRKLTEDLNKLHGKFFDRFPDVSEIYLTSNEGLDGMVIHNDSGVVKTKINETSQLKSKELSAKSFVPKYYSDQGFEMSDLNTGDWLVYEQGDNEFNIINRHSRKKHQVALEQGLSDEQIQQELRSKINHIKTNNNYQYLEDLRVDQQADFSKTDIAKKIATSKNGNKGIFLGDKNIVSKYLDAERAKYKIFGKPGSYIVYYSKGKSVYRFDEATGEDKEIIKASTNIDKFIVSGEIGKHKVYALTSSRKVYDLSSLKFLNSYLGKDTVVWQEGEEGFQRVNSNVNFDYLYTSKDKVLAAKNSKLYISSEHSSEFELLADVNHECQIEFSSDYRHVGKKSNFLIISSFNEADVTGKRTNEYYFFDFNTKKCVKLFDLYSRSSNSINIVEEGGRISVQAFYDKFFYTAEVDLAKPDEFSFKKYVFNDLDMSINDLSVDTDDLSYRMFRDSGIIGSYIIKPYNPFTGESGLFKRVIGSMLEYSLGTNPKISPLNYMGNSYGLAAVDENYSYSYSSGRTLKLLDFSEKKITRSGERLPAVKEFTNIQGDIESVIKKDDIHSLYVRNLSGLIKVAVNPKTHQVVTPENLVVGLETVNDKKIIKASDYGFGSKNITFTGRESSDNKFNWLAARVLLPDTELATSITVLQDLLNQGESDYQNAPYWHAYVNNIWYQIKTLDLQKSKKVTLKSSQVALASEASKLLSNITSWLDYVDYRPDEKVNLFSDLFAQADDLSIEDIDNIATAIKKSGLKNRIIAYIKSGMSSSPLPRIAPIYQVDNKLQLTTKGEQVIDFRYSASKYGLLLDQLTDKTPSSKNW